MEASSHTGPCPKVGLPTLSSIVNLLLQDLPPGLMWCQFGHVTTKFVGNDRSPLFGFGDDQCVAVAVAAPPGTLLSAQRSDGRALHSAYAYPSYFYMYFY